MLRHNEGMETSSLVVAGRPINLPLATSSARRAGFNFILPFAVTKSRTFLVMFHRPCARSYMVRLLEVLLQNVMFAVKKREC